MAINKRRSARLTLAEAQAREDVARAARIGRIERAIKGAQFFDAELAAIETIVFGAYGRTKLQARRR